MSEIQIFYLLFYFEFKVTNKSNCIYLNNPK